MVSFGIFNKLLIESERKNQTKVLKDNLFFLLNQLSYLWLLSCSTKWNILRGFISFEIFPKFGFQFISLMGKERNEKKL